LSAEANQELLFAFAVGFGRFFKESNNDDKPTVGGLLLLTLKSNTFKTVYVAESRY
jgi:hypothetical protein